MRQLALTILDNHYIIQPVDIFQFNGLYACQYDIGEVLTIFY